MEKQRGRDKHATLFIYQLVERGARLVLRRTQVVGLNPAMGANFLPSLLQCLALGHLS